MKRLFFTLAILLAFSQQSYATDITWADKSTGDSYTAANANETKAAVNSKLDKTGTAYRILQTDVSGNVTELAFGTSGQVVTSNGASAALTFETPSGSGDMLQSTYDADTNDLVDSSEAMIIEVRKGSAGTITKGSPVYQSDWNVSGYVEVELADADGSGTMPCVGLAAEDITNVALANVITFGVLTGVATDSFSAEDPLYVSTTTGTLTATKPSGATDDIQKIGTVLRSHSSAGVIFVSGANRTNDVPNTISNVAFNMGGSLSSLLYDTGSNFLLDTDTSTNHALSASKIISLVEDKYISGTENDYMGSLLNLTGIYAVDSTNHAVTIDNITPAAFTITEISIACSVDPTTELTLTFYHKAAGMGYGTPTTIEAVTTTAGVATITSGIDDATIPAGVKMFMSLSDPDAALLECAWKLEGDFD